MSFTYALHFHNIGSCCLNWDVLPSVNQKALELLNINDQVIIMFIVFGYYPEEYSVTCSPKPASQFAVNFM